MNMRKKGQIIRYQSRDNYVHAVIIDSREDYIEFLELVKLEKFVRCYDDADAVYPDDKDNVRLESFRSQFSVDFDVYVIADMTNAIVQSEEDCKNYGVEVMYDGKCISDEDLYKIYHHPWDKQHEKERTYTESLHIIPGDVKDRGAEAEARFGHIKKKESVEDGLDFRG